MLWDISPPIFEGSPTFPGDTRYSQTWSSRLSLDCPVNVASLQLSPHIGAHADAPLHYDAQGVAIGDVDLNPYLGVCRVIHCIGVRPLVEWQHIAQAIAAPRQMDSKQDPLPPRIVIRAYQHAPTKWDDALPAICPQAITRLADLGVVLIGIDSASIDPASSKTLDSHQVIQRRQMRVLENLVLDDVPEGDYELIALPLKLMSADASPVRAVLRSLR